MVFSRSSTRRSVDSHIPYVPHLPVVKLLLDRVLFHDAIMASVMSTSQAQSLHTAYHLLECPTMILPRMVTAPPRRCATIGPLHW